MRSWHIFRKCAPWAFQISFLAGSEIWLGLGARHCGFGVGIRGLGSVLGLVSRDVKTLYLFSTSVGISKHVDLS